MLFQRKVAFFVIIVGIFGSLLTPVFSLDFASATSDEEGGDAGGGGDNGGGGDGGDVVDEPDPEPQPEPEPEPEPEPGPEPSPDPGLVPGPEPPRDPCLENPVAEGCTSPIDPCIENPNAEGCEPDPGLVGPTPQPMPPYEGCLLDPTLPECTPLPGGECPPGTLMNGYGQCYPDKPCPPGYARADNDVSGACLPLNTPTPTPAPGGNCDPSYPDKCVPSPPPDLGCNDISLRNFQVIGSDPHGFDRDSDGIGCEGSGNGSSGGGGGGGGSSDGCDPSYPEDCIRSPPPDLDCGDEGVPNNVKVLQPDPHRLDGDKDGVGCEGISSGGGGNDNNNGGGGSTSTNECQGQADCFRGTVTEIVDGDTLDINNVRVRLALVNTPERGENGYTEAIDFVQSVCSVGTTALVDEDDGQKEGSFDRVIGLVYCGNDNINNKKSLNELLLEGGYAVIYQEFCGISEFSSVSWSQSRGC